MDVRYRVCCFSLSGLLSFLRQEFVPAFVVVEGLSTEAAGLDVVTVGQGELVLVVGSFELVGFSSFMVFNLEKIEKLIRYETN